jgi:hypothetical protein
MFVTIIDARAAELSEDFIEEGDACYYALSMLAGTEARRVTPTSLFPSNFASDISSPTTKPP